MLRQFIILFYKYQNKIYKAQNDQLKHPAQHIKSIYKINKHKQDKQGNYSNDRNLIIINNLLIDFDGES